MPYRLILKAFVCALGIFLSWSACAEDAGDQQTQIAGAVDQSQVCDGLQNQTLMDMVVYGNSPDPAAFQGMGNDVVTQNAAKNCLAGIGTVVSGAENGDPGLMNAIKTRLQSALIWISSKVQQNNNPIITQPMTIGIRG